MLINIFYVLSEIDILPFPISAIHFHSYISALSLASRNVDDATRHDARNTPFTVHLTPPYAKREQIVRLLLLPTLNLQRARTVAVLRSDGRLPQGPATNHKRHQGNAQTELAGKEPEDGDEKDCVRQP